MKTETISKAVEKYGWKFSFEHAWPESDEETLKVWGTPRCVNHAHKDVVIALRAHAESLVKAHIRKALNVANKDADDAFYLSVQPDVLAAAVAHMQTVMPGAEIPSGERVVLNPVDRANRETDKLTREEGVELVERLAAEYGLKVRKA